MSNVELVVAALVAGATAVPEGADGEAVRGSYTALKGALSHELAERPEVHAALEAEVTDPVYWHKVLDDTDIGEDVAVTELAQHLLSIAEPGKYNVDLREAKSA
ncbi:hypothetical protein AB0I28_34160 [Phytomonospora sp. NPDC050363]|uniref:hypothetical protein n=1 Tax=Phytomonospora sp. NPDC050363 TaxID=3155642 RepID=UPI0033D7F981